MDNYNKEMGEFVREFKGTLLYTDLTKLKDNLVKDLINNLFLPANDGKAIESEMQLGQILAYRKGVIDGVEKLFKLMDHLEQAFLDSQKP